MSSSDIIKSPCFTVLLVGQFRYDIRRGIIKKRRLDQK